MNIVIINGSPRPRGATGTLLRAAARHLEAKGDVAVEFVDLGSLEMKLCRGCASCYRTGRCAIDADGLEAIAERTKAADGVIIGSPTFGSNVTPQLKNFMDRGHFIMEQGLYGKQAFALATYEIAEGSKALAAIRKFLLVSGAARRGRLLAKVRFGADPLADPKLAAALYASLDRFHAAVRGRAGRSLFERIFTDLLVVRSIWRPHLLARPEQYRAVTQRYQALGIHRACWVEVS